MSSVPQMNGNAPNSPSTGSQVSVVQNFSPNSWIESSDSRHRTAPMATTMSTSASANDPGASIGTPGRPNLAGDET